MPYLTNSDQPCPKCQTKMRCYVDDDGTLLSEWCPFCHYTEKGNERNGKGTGEIGRDSGGKGA